MSNNKVEIWTYKDLIIHILQYIIQVNVVAVDRMKRQNIIKECRYKQDDL